MKEVTGGESATMYSKRILIKTETQFAVNRRKNGANERRQHLVALGTRANQV